MEITTTSERETEVYNGFYGWIAETFTTVKDRDYQITTMKRSSGQIVCNAQYGKRTAHGFSHMMFTDPCYLLHTENAKATEKKVREVHALGLKAFDALGVVQNAKEKYRIEVGQFLFYCGRAENTDYQQKLAVYDITEGFYRCVDLHSFELSNIAKAGIKDFNERSGIGYYYIENDFADSMAMAQAVEKGTALAKRGAEEKANLQEIRRQKLLEGAKQLPTLPASVHGLIIAEFRVNKSDYQSDYFGYETKQVVFLAFSDHKRHVFPELRKAAGKCPIEEINQHATAPTVDRNGRPRTEENKSYWECSDEHRENYTGGDGYYLGESKYSGWIIRKITYEIDLEQIQLAIAEGRCYIPFAGAENSGFESLISNGVEISEYSEKALVVRGDTKPIKDQLKALGGRFNFRLQGGAGWIFPKRQETQLRQLLS